MDGLTAVVTGADRDLGEAVARRFAVAGAQVIAGARDPDALGTDGSDPDALAPAEASETGVVAVRADVRDEYDVERLLERAARESDGGVDVVAACAEVDHGGQGDRSDRETSLTEESYAAFDDTLRTNARGVFATIREAVPHLSDDARVLVPAGSAAREFDAEAGRRQGRGSYAVSKAAAAALARGFAAELDQTVGVVDHGSAADEAGAERRGETEDAELEIAADLLVWAATEAPREEVDGRVVEPAAFDSDQQMA